MQASRERMRMFFFSASHLRCRQPVNMTKMGLQKRGNAECVQRLCEIYLGFSQNQWTSCIIQRLLVGFAHGGCALPVFFLWTATRHEQIEKTTRSW
jgi:hypothetical protein